MKRGIVFHLPSISVTTLKWFTWSPSHHHLRSHTFLSAVILHFIILVFSDESSPAPTNYWKCFSSVANRLFPCSSSAFSIQRQQYAFHYVDQESSASCIIVSSSDAGIDVMAISVSSVTCPKRKCIHVWAHPHIAFHCLLSSWCGSCREKMNLICQLGLLITGLFFFSFFL